MKSKRPAIFLLTLCMFLVNRLYGQYPGLYSSQTNYITDMVLIYQGGTHRPDWTTSRFAPYVYRTEQDGTVSFLFDAFLFIEFKTNLGQEYASGYSLKPAGKKEWTHLLDCYYEKDKGVRALNEVLDSLSQKGITPERKRKVVLNLPEPIQHQKDWGQVDSSFLDFDADKDRVVAIKWYIDEALRRWQNANLNQLELAGFYWVSEQTATSKEVLPDIGNYIRSKGLKFYWIPYWGASGSTDWKQWGFDMAYQQPNYFFQKDASPDRIDKVCASASNYRMGLEMEFDSRVDQPSFQDKFFAYLDGFKASNVWNASSVAYYEGGIGFYQLATDPRPEMKRVYDALCDVIIERQQKADKIHNRELKKEEKKH